MPGAQVEKDDDIGDENAALAMLSPAERAAMLEDAEDDAQAAAKVADGADDEEDDKGAKPAAAEKPDADDDADDEDDEDGADDGKAAAAAKETAAAADDTATKEETPAAQQEPIKLDLSHVDQRYNAALESLDNAKAAEFKKLMDGEITSEDYSKFESQYLRNRDAAAADRNDATAWFKEVNAFQNDVLKSDGVNYATDAKMNAAFDRWVKNLASDPDNAQKDGSWFLKEAHEMVKMQYRIGGDKPSQAQAEKPGKEAAKPAKPAGRAPDTSNLPKTLGSLPAAADAESADEGEFAHIEKLTGIERERVLARMTPEQEDRYLRS